MSLVRLTKVVWWVMEKGVDQVLVGNTEEK